VISFGGRAASAVAQRLEEMGRAGDLTGAEGVLEELEAELEQFSDFYSSSSLLERVTDR